MIHYMEQHTEEWFAIKSGKPSASRVTDIVKGVKGRYLAGREDYLLELAYETLTGEREEHFVSADMQHGTEFEPIARATYEAKKGTLVDEVGFIDHDTIKNFGASPDGLVGKDGSIEIKCPKPKQHIKTLLKGHIKRDYLFQIQTLLMCSNRKWCDFVSFDPKAPDYLQLYIQRFHRDEIIIAEIETEVKKFNAELAQMVKQLKDYDEV